MEINYLSKKIGIIGGGQLGKMMINEASKLGISTAILDPGIDCPASPLANEAIVAAFNDKAALEELAKKTDVLTCEFEHISTEALKYLEDHGYIVYPKAKSLEAIQNKYQQKKLLQDNSIPLGPFKKADSTESIKAAAAEYGYPLMVKSASGAYDGKGNYLVTSEEEISEAYSSLNGDENLLYVEQFIPFTKEISVLCCRTMNGEIVVYPVAENIHRDSILYETIAPANITDKQTQDAEKLAKEICHMFDGVGMFCVEMFVHENGDILVNEVAPRPHNSGHYTIEACITSQFENHVRAVLGLPLGKTDLHSPVVMRNLLGEDGHEGIPLVKGVSEALAYPGLTLHIYGKSTTKPQRKMGHFTVLAKTVEEALSTADQAQSVLKIISEKTPKG
ncbi:5-(carboxyamino)imidazole ribonucleotide synthase [Alkalibacter saccharofermentans]|uniref:N5-carboxyaminoimidazole ribonucleotide synthase n=1 Tax=Alkalibacter saccharofermentans DSM 14828 TaxID=1120975 RepID=A0A1M4ZAX8_9FIRM|nr:5-(carboxyamino)imidazole ribonucleotide synthase [Alkalibacter saccharofermentans]SHF15200.1 5-(carboxyamino)imidazole ribonucleotide synthase [Alkalibacter saccharofermentans DSM 14828]